jgi:hypothetical protein
VSGITYNFQDTFYISKEYLCMYSFQSGNYATKNVSSCEVVMKCAVFVGKGDRGDRGGGGAGKGG